MRDVVLIEGVTRNYAWGSPTAIPNLLGRAGDGRPVAELWFGAHPDDPSPAQQHSIGAIGLDELIARDPSRLLGPTVLERYGPRLPFLIKLLAAAQPLSIQVHPDLAQARAGFAAEQARGIPSDAPARNYRDSNHKPELLYALTPFEALCGFRPVAATLRLLSLLDLTGLAPIAALLAGPDGLRAAFTALLELDDPSSLVSEVVTRAGEIVDEEFHSSLRAVERCARAFPGDVGVVLSLLLNAVTLAPGEAIYLGAGNVHAYLAGFGVEVMANSDNVLRCGLTSKHVDVDELLSITDFRPLENPRWAPDGDTFVVPVPDFTLSVMNVEGAAVVDACGPCIVVCTRGRAEVDAQVIAAGSAVFLGADDEPVPVSGSAQLFLATVS
jgi:mannose-6-phosphate isomerase